PRSTVQYWRNKVMSQGRHAGETRTVTRGASTYELHIANLGSKRSKTPAQSRRDQTAQIAEQRQRASAPVKSMLNVFEKFVRGQLSAPRLCELIETQLCAKRDSCPFRRRDDRN